MISVKKDMIAELIPAGRIYRVAKMGLVYKYRFNKRHDDFGEERFRFWERYRYARRYKYSIIVKGDTPLILLGAFDELPDNYRAITYEEATSR